MKEKICFLKTIQMLYPDPGSQSDQLVISGVSIFISDET